MKKILYVLLIAMMIFALVACGFEGVPPADSQQVQSWQDAAQQEQAEQPTTPEIEPAATDDIQYEFTNIQEQLYQSMFGDIRFQTLIQITNMGNVPIYMGSVYYDLLDEDGRILRANNTLSSYPNILHPGESGYFYDSVSVPEATLDTVTTIAPRWNLRRARANRINFDISDVEIREGTWGGITVLGRITNNTGEEQSWAIISAILYTEDGTSIGVWMTNVMETMPDGTSFGFEVSGIMDMTLFDNVTPDMVYRYVVFAYPPQWQF